MSGLIVCAGVLSSRTGLTVCVCINVLSSRTGLTVSVCINVLSSRTCLTVCVCVSPCPQFSDVLVYTSRTTSPVPQFKVHGQLPLRGVSVEQTDSQLGIANCFTIFGGNRSAAALTV